MTCCPTCDRRVHNHSYCLKCCNCLQLYHLKCVTLNKDEQNILLTNKAIWICLKCNIDIFPFNNIDEDVDFLQACQTSSQNELLTSTLIYNPFQSNENDYIIWSEFDPDFNFYCEQNIFSGFLCKYFKDESFNEKLSSLSSEDVLSFSLCHINIRSIKANLGDFDNYMRMLNLDFSIIGVTETWLNDINYDLYGLDGYELIERHRANKMGGGTGLFLRNGVSYKTRADLTTFEYYLIISWYLHVWNGVAVAAYSRLASRTQVKFHTMKLSPLVRPCAAAPAQSTTSAHRSLDFRRATSSQRGRWVGSWPLLLHSVH